MIINTLAQSRRARNRAEMRAAILDAARAVMREQGVAALNLNQVSSRLGIKTPSLYEYLNGKHAIYDALFRLGFELLSERLTPVLQNAKTWQDLLRGSIETYMQFALDYPELYQLCFARPIPGFVPSETSARIRLELAQFSRQHVARVTERDGAWLGMNPAQASDLSIALIHGLTAQHLATEPHLPMGQGRFGGLVPIVLRWFNASRQYQPSTTAPHSPHR